MASSTKTVVGALAVIAIVVGIGVGVYFIFFNKSGDADSGLSGTVMLLMNTGYGEILEVNLNDQSNRTRAESFTNGFTTFDLYQGKDLIYYGTNQLDKGYQRVGADAADYPGEITKSRPWIKTALAVDYVTEKIYAVNSMSSAVYVVDLKDKYEKVLYHEDNNNLKEPLDIVLDPQPGKLFVLQKNKILQSSMDGSGWGSSIAPQDATLKAFAIDRKAKELIYGTHDGLIHSYDYVNDKMTKKVAKVSSEGTIRSMAVLGDDLFVAVTKTNPDNEVLLTGVWRTDNVELRKVHVSPPIETLPMQSIRLYNKKNTYVAPENKCANNGGCEQLCLLSSKTDNKQGYSCACQDGWVVNTGDPKKCTKA